jgi:hypothetical protein
MRIVLALIISLLLFACNEQNKEEVIETPDSTVTSSELEQTNEDTQEELDHEGSFEGQITYKITFQTKGNPKEYAGMKDVFGDTVVVTFSKGNYAMEYTDGRIQYIKYLRDNYQYRKMIWLDTLYFNDASFENSTLFSASKSKTDTKILDRNVDVVTIITDKFKKFYYYDPDIYMNPKYFENHNFGYENKYYELSQSPYLYSEIVYDQLKVIFEAIKIEEKEIPASFFVLPDLITKPSHEMEEG